MRLRLLPALLAGLLLTACGHSPEPRYYALSLPAADAIIRTHAGTVIGLADVRLPDYLQSPFIVRRLDGNRLQHNPLQRWAEPLASAVPDNLAARLALALPAARIQRSPWSAARQPALQVRLEIEQLDADDRQLQLSARWQITDRDQKPRLSRSARFGTPLPAAGTAGIVAAHDQALARLAALLADDLRPLQGTVE